MQIEVYNGYGVNSDRMQQATSIVFGRLPSLDMFSPSMPVQYVNILDDGKLPFNAKPLNVVNSLGEMTAFKETTVFLVSKNIQPTQTKPQIVYVSDKTLVRSLEEVAISQIEVVKRVTVTDHTPPITPGTGTGNVSELLVSCTLNVWTELDLSLEGTLTTTNLPSFMRIVDNKIQGVPNMTGDFNFNVVSTDGADLKITLRVPALERFL